MLPSQSKNTKTTSGELHVLLHYCTLLNTYFELLQFIEIIYITNKCNQYVICLPFVHFVRIFMRNIQTTVSPHPLKIGHMFIWTYLLGIVNISTSSSIHNSFWNNLYNSCRFSTATHLSVSLYVNCLSCLAWYNMVRKSLAHVCKEMRIFLLMCILYLSNLS